MNPQQQQELEQVPNRPITRTSFLHAFVAQSDWEGPVAQETWYGHHAPGRRTLLFALLPGVIMSWATMQALRSAPVFAATYRYDEFHNTTMSCLNALCDAVQEAPITCNVDRYGAARVVWEGYDGYDRLPLPVQCVNAVQKLFDLDLDADENAFLRDVTLLAVRSNDPTNETALFRLVDDQCALELTADAAHNAFPLLGKDEQPGRVSNVLEYLTCPDRMEWMSDDARRDFRTGFEWAFENRNVIARVALLGFWALFAIGYLIGLMILLFMTTTVIRFALPSPSPDLVGLKQITFWSTWRTLLLNSLLTTDYRGLDLGGDIYTLFGLLIAGACYYKEKRAAFEWTFLAFLNYGFETAEPILNSVASAIQVFDTLNLVGFAGWLVGLIIPGIGWWKLVHLYFFCISYTPMRKWIHSQLPGGKQEKVEEEQQHDEQQAPLLQQQATVHPF